MTDGIEVEARARGPRGFIERFSTQNFFILALSLLCLGFGLVGVALGAWVVSDLGAPVRGLLLVALGALVAATGLRCFWTEYAEGERLAWLDALMERSLLQALGSESVHAAWVVIGRATIIVGVFCLVASALTGGDIVYSSARDLMFGLACAGVLYTGLRTILIARQLMRDAP